MIRIFVLLLALIFAGCSPLSAKESWKDNTWKTHKAFDKELQKDVPYMYISTRGFYQNRKGPYKNLLSQIAIYNKNDKISVGFVMYNGDPSFTDPLFFQATFYMKSGDASFECIDSNKWSDFGGIEMGCGADFIRFLKDAKDEVNVQIYDQYFSEYQFIFPMTNFFDAYEMLN